MTERDVRAIRSAMTSQSLPRLVIHFDMKAVVRVTGRFVGVGMRLQGGATRRSPQMAIAHGGRPGGAGAGVEPIGEGWDQRGTTRARGELSTPPCEPRGELSVLPCGPPVMLGPCVRGRLGRKTGRPVLVPWLSV